MVSSLIQKEPRLQFLIGFLITTIYLPGVFGATIPTGWFLIIILGALLITGNVPLFIIYCAISLLWTENFNIGLFFLFQFIGLWGIYCLGKVLKDLKPLFKGLAVGLGISGLIAIEFQAGFYSVGNERAGLFVNPNIFCEVSAVIFIGLIALKLWWWIWLAIPGLMIVHSRAALATVGICFLVMILKKDRVYGTLGLMFVLLVLLLRIDTLTDLNSTNQRIDLWVDTFRGLNFFGNGIGSYEILYPLYATHIDTLISRPRYAHNDLLHLVFEFGIGTLLLIPIILKINLKSDYAIILYGIFIISLFAFPLHVPVLAFLASLVAGYLSRDNDSIRTNGNSSRQVISKRYARG